MRKFKHQLVSFLREEDGLVLVEGLSYAEAAQVLGVPADAPLEVVKSAWKTAVRPCIEATEASGKKSVQSPTA